MDSITEIFAAVMELASALDVKNIYELPACWEYKVDENWSIAVNGHNHPMKCAAKVTVQPFHCYVEWNGIPAGEIGPNDGLIAMGEEANERTLIAALKAATEKAKNERKTPADRN